MDQLLKQGFKHANIGIAFVDKDGNFQMVNPFFTKLTKYSEEELLKMNYNNLCTEMNVEPDNAEFKSLVNREKDYYELEKQCVSKEGDDIWVNLVVSRLESPNEKEVMFMRLTQDITEKKKSEAEVKKLNELMMGRELKMVELKKEIEELKARK